MAPALRDENTPVDPSADVPQVILHHSPANDEEEAHKRRGAVPKELKDQIAIRGIIGRSAVQHGYATNRADSRSFGRSQSEASIFFRPLQPQLEPPVSEQAIDNPSNMLWRSGYTQLKRTTSSVISGLNDDVLRAGWRRNEPGPYWEQSHELEPDRQAVCKIPEEAEPDGFDVEEMEFEDPTTDSSPAVSADLVSLMKDDEGDLADEAADQLGAFKPSAHSKLSHLGTKRPFSKTQSMPVGGTFGTRPDQPKFYRPFDETFMRMDEEF